MAFLNTKITGNGLAQTAITNDAILEAVVNSLVAFNTTGGALNFSVLINDSVLFTESVAANDTFRIPDKINVGASSTFKVTADTGVDVSVSYLQQAIDTAGALSAAQIASQAAQTAATSAATSYDNFDDRYLGNKASDPTLDNDGAALLTGALYFNTTSSGMKVYDGAAWQTAYANLGGVLALTGGTMTGAITSLRETKIAMAANDINLAGGNLFTKTISGATTLTVSNVPTTGNVGYMILELTNAGSAAITWFSGVKWAGGVAPTLTAAGKDIISMYSHDGGTVWNVSSIQKDVK